MYPSRALQTLVSPTSGLIYRDSCSSPSRDLTNLLSLSLSLFRSLSPSASASFHLSQFSLFVSFAYFSSFAISSRFLGEHRACKSAGASLGSCTYRKGVSSDSSSSGRVWSAEGLESHTFLTRDISDPGDSSREEIDSYLASVRWTAKEKEKGERDIFFRAGDFISEIANERIIRRAARKTERQNRARRANISATLCPPLYFILR